MADPAPAVAAVQPDFDMADSNTSHFKLLAAGLSAEPLAALGEALLALQQARGSAPAESAAAWVAAGGRLDNACQSLLSALLRAHGTALNAQQWLFAESGALESSIPLKSPEGERIELGLLPAESYSLLLTDSLMDAGASDHESDPLAAQIFTARTRIEALLSGRLEPLDLSQDPKVRSRAHERLLHGGQPGAAVDQAPDKPAPDLSARQHEEALRRWQKARSALEQAQQKLSGSVRDFAASVSAQRLSALLAETGEILRLCQQALTPEAAADPAAAALQDLPDAAVLLGGSIEDTASTALLSLARHRRECSQALLDLRMLQSALSGSLPAAAENKAGNTLTTKSPAGRTALSVSPPPPGPLTPEQLAKVEADFKATGELMRQSQQQLRRGGQRCGRVLLSDYFARHKDGEPLPPGSFASSEAVREALGRLLKLHSNCFVLDSAGQPLLPPIIIEPGVSTAVWLDDRYLLAYTQVQPALTGAALSFSALDQALLRLMGLYLARGEIYNYRGERLRDSFMGEFAGEVEQKAVVKFTGADKRMTYGSSSTEKDSAGREDAVRDYIDFLFHVYNNLPLPKRISTRRAGVLLKYVHLDEPVRNVRLALRLLHKEEPQLCRDVMHQQGGRSVERITELIGAAIASDQQLAVRYRDGAQQALREVMGREFAEDAQEKAQQKPLPKNTAPAGADPAAESAANEEAPVSGHDYFEL